MTIKTPEPVEQLPQATLKAYCENNSCALDPLQCLKAINAVHHARALRVVWRLLIKDMQPESKGSKTKVLWIGGLPSTGKSFVTRRLRQIFSGDEVDWRGDYLPVRVSNRPDLHT